MKNIAIMTAGLMAVAGVANAGGIVAPAEPMVMAPVAPAPVVSTWTGGYAGLSIGGGAANYDGDVPFDLNDDGDDDDDDDILGFDTDAEGLVGGAFAGYRYQLPSGLVVGGELDLNAANIDLDSEFLDGIEDDNDETAAEIKQIHRLKLQAGYGIGDFLVYGTGGAAYADAEILGEDFNDVGYVVGLGVDYHVTPTVTVGAEALYHEFDDFDDTGIDAEVTTLQARVGFQF